MKLTKLMLVAFLILSSISTRAQFDLNTDNVNDQASKQDGSLVALIKTTGKLGLNEQNPSHKLPVNGLARQSQTSKLVAIQANEYYATITGVHDGDGTYYATTENGVKVKLRLRNIDCPEIFSPYVTKTQPYGIEASRNVRNLIKGKKVYVVTFGKSFKRDISDITYYEDSLLTKPKDLRTVIVKNGWGWFDGDNRGIKIPSDSRYVGGRGLMRQAKKLKLGLWQDSLAIEPKKWRLAYRPKRIAKV